MYIEHEETQFNIYDLPFNQTWPVLHNSQLGQQIIELLNQECTAKELETTILHHYCKNLTPEQIIKGVQRIRIQAFAEGLSARQNIDA